MISESVLALLIYCGLGVGVILSYIAPEELKPGKASFEWGMRIALSGVLVLAIQNVMQLSLSIGAILFMLALYIFYHFNNLERLYYVCAAALVISVASPFFFYQSALAFFAGMCAAGITLSKYATKVKLTIPFKEGITKVAMHHRTFLVVYFVTLAITWLI